MAVIIDGKALANKILDDIGQKVSKLKTKPGLAVILAGCDPASSIYVKNKEKQALKSGFNSYVKRLPEDVSENELFKLIEELNDDKNVDGILLQLPLPKHLNEKDFLDKISPKKDADGFHPLNTGKLLSGENPYALPCTPKGIMRLLDEYKIPVEGQNAVVIGRSNIVGKPLALLLLAQNATVTVAHSKTRNLAEITKKADILISATGRKNMVTADMVKEGAAVIDVGITRGESGKICGDVDFENVKNKAGFITPVPGGIGPMTIASLIENTYDLHLLNNPLQGRTE